MFLERKFADVGVYIVNVDGGVMGSLTNVHKFNEKHINLLSDLGFLFEDFNHVRLSKGKVLELFGSLCNDPVVSSCSNGLVVCEN